MPRGARGNAATSVPPTDAQVAARTEAFDHAYGQLDVIKSSPVIKLEVIKCEDDSELMPQILFMVLEHQAMQLTCLLTVMPPLIAGLSETQRVIDRSK